MWPLVVLLVAVGAATVSASPLSTSTADSNPTPATGECNISDDSQIWARVLPSRPLQTHAIISPSPAISAVWARPKSGSRRVGVLVKGAKMTVPSDVETSDTSEV
ncbi:hypothetical protein DFH09DRAFT_1097294 [Mycena vulgaris]|nr:hypothetical protein DFH09DRAFT_1097294 [Mycena vulgaris]